MTWPEWSDVLPSLTLVAVGAGLMWTIVRLLVRPVADKAAQDAADKLYDRLKGNDFRHVEKGLKALEGRIVGVRKDFGGRLDRMDHRIAGVRKDVGERFDRARQDRTDMEARLLAAIQGRSSAPE